MQKLRPYLLPGIFVFHLLTVWVVFSIIPPLSDQNNLTSLELVRILICVLALTSQFFLTALGAGWGAGSWVLRIPSWAALAALSWLSFVVFSLHTDGDTLDSEVVWGITLAPPVGWIVLVAFLLFLRAMFLKWRIALQPMSPDSQSRQPRQSSLTRGIPIVAATLAGVLMLLKDSWPWSELEMGDNSLPIVVGAIFFSGLLVPVTIIGVSLTLTRLSDWLFYRRRWTLPFLVAVAVYTAIALPLIFHGSFEDGRAILLAVLWCVFALATQPLTTLLVLGMAGYRLTPRKRSAPDASKPTSVVRQSASADPVENWLVRLQRAHFAAPVATLAFFVGVVPTDILDRHYLMISADGLRRNSAGEITRLNLPERTTNASLRAISELDKLQALDLATTQITDTGLAQLSGMNLKELTIPKPAQTDLGLKHYLAAVKPPAGLSLSGWKITDAGLVNLKGLTNLRRLVLPKQITDAGVVHLVGMKLAVLRIPQQAKTDLGLKHYLAAIEPPNALDLPRWQITDAGLVYIKRLTNLETLSLRKTKVTDAGLVHLKSLINLTRLNLWESEVTDVGLVHLKGLTELRGLGLRNTQITDAGLVHLKGLTNLQTLDLSHTQVTDAGLVHLAGLNLKSLVIPKQARTDIGLKHFLAAVEPSSELKLRYWEITDAGLVHLRGLPNLQSLYLPKQLTDVGLVHLAGMNLKSLVIPKQARTDIGLKHFLAAMTPSPELDLGNWQITDAGLEHLKEWTNMQGLGLRSTQITDAGIAHLKELTRLERLDLHDTQITFSAVAELRNALPNCKVENAVKNVRFNSDANLSKLALLPPQRQLRLYGDKITDTGLAHLQGQTELQTLELTNTGVTDAGLVYLQNLTHLRDLSFLNWSGEIVKITDAGLAHLKGMTDLQSLYLARTQITDAGLVHLKGLTELRGLGLRNTQITDAGMVHLKELTNLQKLDLYGTKITAAGLVHLKGLHLQRLTIPQRAKTDLGLTYYLAVVAPPPKMNFNGWKLTDQGLVHLVENVELVELSLNDTQITDTGIRHLKQLPRLQSLNLRGTQVTDASLEYLETLTGMIMLDLRNTQITTAGAAKLKNTLPKCSIAH